eukprot:4506491-Pleurochrysis_carterae.AAC.9
MLEQTSQPPSTRIVDQSASCMDRSRALVFPMHASLPSNDHAAQRFVKRPARGLICYWREADAFLLAPTVAGARARQRRARGAEQRGVRHQRGATLSAGVLVECVCAWLCEERRRAMGCVRVRGGALEVVH